MTEAQMVLARIQTVISFVVIMGMVAIVAFFAWEAERKDTMKHDPVDTLLDDPGYLRRVNDGQAYKRYWYAGRNLKNKE